MARGKKKKGKGIGRIILLILEILLLLVVAAAVWLWYMYSQVEDDNVYTDSELGITYTDTDEEIGSIFSGPYTNIAMFGLDNRSSCKYDSGNSDTIMVLSINNETKEVKIVSVYRDTYLLVGDGKYRKANAAYNIGGVSNAIRMLNQNLDLTGSDAIRHYICVDWNALVEAIDGLGGVDIEITEEERKWINRYLSDTARGTDATSENVTESGLVHLNGLQATSYARIRYTSGNDYLRTSRQRILIQAILEKAREADILTLTKVCNAVISDVQTSLSVGQILTLAKDLNSYELVSTTGFPFDLTTAELSVTGDTVIPIDLYGNVVQLHEYLFDDTNYQPTQTLCDISNTIISLTGLSASNAIPADNSQYNETVGANGTSDLSEIAAEKEAQEQEMP